MREPSKRGPRRPSTGLRREARSERWRDLLVDDVTRALELGLGEVLQNEKRDHGVLQQVCSDVPEGSRGVARGAVSRENDEIDLLPLRHVEKGLMPVHAADYDRAHRHALSSQLIANVIEV